MHDVTTRGEDVTKCPSLHIVRRVIRLRTRLRSFLQLLRVERVADGTPWALRGVLIAGRARQTITFSPPEALRGLSIAEGDPHGGGREMIAQLKFVLEIKRTKKSCAIFTDNTTNRY